MIRAVMVPIVMLMSVAGCSQPGPERVTPIAVELNGAGWADAYTYAQGGTTVETLGGRLPVVDWRGRKAIKLHVTHSPGGFYEVGIAKRGWGRFQLDDYGRDGRLEFAIAGDVRGNLSIGIASDDQDGPGPATGATARVPVADYVPVGPEWQPVAVQLGDFLDAEPALDLGHMLKIAVHGSAEAGESTLYLADIAFRTTQPEPVYPRVKVNQVGYRPGWRKVAKVTPAAPFEGERNFSVLRAESGETAYEGALTAAVLDDESSGDDVYDADFSGLGDAGAYVVEVPGIGRSTPFRIAEDIYDGLFHDVARFWLCQRCGIELGPECAGPYAHPACHGFDEAIPDPAGGTRDCRGGWHDAGDMNCYTPWTIQPIFMLLSLYRHYPEGFADGQLNLPESGNGIPDLLDEVKYELQWVRKMLVRDGPDRGKVYDRVHESLAEQPGGVGFYERRHGLSGTTDEAACALEADLAHAYLVYRGVPGEEEFANACLEDALLVWDHLKTRDGPDASHYFTAAALLFEATGRDDAQEVVKRLAGGILNEWHGRINYGSYDGGLAAYALSERPEVDEALQTRLRDYYKAYADAVVEASRSSGYNAPMVPGVVFSWGSNGHCIAKSGAHLLMVNRFAPDPRYVETARDALHWLLGRNPVNTCMVTGHGDPPLGPIYHSMYGPLGPGLPMPPGYLPGGVNCFDCPGLSVHPAKAWRPAHTCWELTEPSLTYQGSFTYLVGALAALGDGRPE